MISSLFKFTRVLVTLSLFFASYLASEIIVDGKLSEEEWSKASYIDEFLVVQPNTLEEPENKTKVFYFANEDGIYFGFENDQRKDSQTERLHKRDSWSVSADRNFVFLDFSGNSSNAYSFGVTLGGSLGDAIWQNENEPSSDWDGLWYAAESQEGDKWFSEFHIPWDVAPIPVTDSKFLEFKIRFVRYFFEENEWTSYPPIWGDDSRFISKFEPIQIQNFTKEGSADVDFYPYLTISQEEVTNKQQNKIGGEIFWSIDAEKRLDVTLNPDFGQVESDDVIVSFDATETFYDDKRPFFTENQSLFSITGWRLYVLNTRRIGASPDYNCDNLKANLIDKCNSDNRSSSNIDVALRYTQKEKENEFGIFSAFERDDPLYQGRNFQAVRYRRIFEEGKVGYMLTYADKPNISRTAQVHTMDYEYSIDENTRFFGMLSYSEIDQSGESTEGAALRAVASRVFNQKFSGLWALSVYDEGYDLNDMGYMEMKEYISTGWQARYKESDFPDSSPLRNLTLDTNGGHQRSISGINGGGMGYFSLNLDFKDYSSVDLFCECILVPGKDYMETRGNPEAPFIRRLGGYNFFVRYQAPQDRVFIPSFKVQSNSGGYKFDDPIFARRGEGWGFNLGATIQPTDNLDINLGLIRYDEEKNWNKFEYDKVFGFYDYKKLSSSLSLGWFLDNTHELRIKAQFYALTADNPSAFSVSEDGKMQYSDAQLNPFELSQVAFQIRYRYELAPLSHFYVVYTRGGYYFDEDKDLSSFGDLYTSGWDTTYSDQFVLKIRYKF